MKNAIILHGIDDAVEDILAMPNSPSNSHWFPWLQWELIKKGILAQTPEMPRPYLKDMNYDEWVGIIEQFQIDKNSILIGHSCGGGFFLKYLSLNPNIKVGQLVLVAPWLDTEQDSPTFFNNLYLDPDLPARVGQIDVFLSSDDMDIIKMSIDKIKSAYDNIIKYHDMGNKGHFCERDLKSKQFPELLAVIK
ncbi:MAG: alpha/beta hydrolase [Rickettsiales bacterium]|jgi:predicted alpha/beta hydrolase family esterase|nr:alpha/beta hydrolase [Rickettsiales bacterium]